LPTNDRVSVRAKRSSPLEFLFTFGLTFTFTLPLTLI